MRKIEISLILLFVLTIILEYTNIRVGQELILFAASMLVMFYCIIGTGILRTRFRISGNDPQPGIKLLPFMRIFSGLVFALSIVSILLNEMLWSARTWTLYPSLILLSFLMFFSLLFFEKTEPGLNRYTLSRSILFSSALLFYLLLPLEKRLEWKYEDQYYREILMMALQNPDDEDAQKRVEDYEERLGY